jgi:hypothetical protein
MWQLRLTCIRDVVSWVLDWQQPEIWHAYR